MTTAQHELATRPLDDDERETIWQHGWATGHTAALAARPADNVYAPHPITWRHTRPGDTFVGAHGHLWHVHTITPTTAGMLRVLAGHGDQQFTVDVDPDEPATVLAPIPERDAITMCVEQLGARLIDRRGGAHMTG